MKVEELNALAELIVNREHQKVKMQLAGKVIRGRYFRSFICALLQECDPEVYTEIIQSLNSDLSNMYMMVFYSKAFRSLMVHLKKIFRHCLFLINN